MTTYKDKIYPQDLYNDSNLLKNVARISLFHLEGFFPENSILSIPSPYIIEKEKNGDTFIKGMYLDINDKCILAFHRPLNSQKSWPLLARDLYGNYKNIIKVFSEYGTFTEEFKQLIKE